LSRRAQIQMTEPEVASFLGEQRIVTCATIGQRGWPHLMPLWYVLRRPATGSDGGGGDRPGPGPADGSETAQRLWSWTYAASQKVRNLERSPRATLQVEAGEQYQELRGVMLECDVIVHRELETVAALGQEIFRRYASPPGQPPAPQLDAEVAAMVDRQARKRVGLEFVELRRATWDHRKLGGAY
jgi:Pyridoxamine 5'-phosphate oxidase